MDKFWAIMLILWAVLGGIYLVHIEPASIVNENISVMLI